MTEHAPDEELVEVDPEHVSVVAEPEPDEPGEKGFAMAEPKDPFYIDYEKNPALQEQVPAPDLGALLAAELELMAGAVSERARRGIAARAALTRTARKAS